MRLHPGDPVPQQIVYLDGQPEHWQETFAALLPDDIPVVAEEDKWDGLIEEISMRGKWLQEAERKALSNGVLVTWLPEGRMDLWQAARFFARAGYLRGRYPESRVIIGSSPDHLMDAKLALGGAIYQSFEQMAAAVQELLQPAPVISFSDPSGSYGVTIWK
jgi:hypothetical protein